MLRKFHNKKFQKRIWIVLLIFILPGFVIWGFSSSLRNPERQDKGYGKVFNKNISEEEYLDALRTVEAQLQMQLGDNYLQLRKLLDPNNMALQRIIMLYEADKRKIRVKDSEITDVIQKDASFYKKGRFDNNLYEQTIKYGLHMQPRAYEEMTRQNLKIRKLFLDVTKEVKLTDAQIREAYSKENEQMSVYYISSIPSDFTQEITPAETELQEFYDKNQAQFKKPLSFNLEYITLDSASQVKSLSEQKDIKDTLEKISQDNKLSIKETGLFGETDPIPGIGWSQEISKALNPLKTGEMLGPMEIEKRFYLFRIKEKKEPFIPEFKVIKTEIQEKFIKNKSRELAKTKMENCAKKIKELAASTPQEIDFDKIAKDFGLKSSSSGLFKFGSYIEGVGASDNFFNTAAKLKENSASEIIEMPSGFYIIKIKDKPALDEKKFSEDKTKFSEKLLEEKKQEYFNDFLKELAKKAQS